MFTGNVIARSQQILANKSVLESYLTKITNDVSLAKLRLSLKDDVDNFLSAMEYNFQKRTIFSFENLLTEIVNDVLPRDEQKVVFELTTQRNLPSLHIYLSQNGFKEDVLTGQGGAVANVLSTGLRLITLIRSQNRKFIVLDEPDCWISPDRVGNFSYVINKISEELGLQVLYISHHDPTILTGKYIKLSLENGAVKTNAIAVNEDELGSIRQIRLINFMSHKDTILNLTKNTIIAGDNNIGKSAIVSALRSVAYGESNDTYIRHNADSATVEITFDDGFTLRWQRFLKGKIKIQYDLIDAGNNIIQTATTASVPDWVTEKLGIAEIDGIDVQLNSQKQPIFLLDEPPSRRAEILSLGQESKYINAMRQIWKRQIDEDRKTVKFGEAEVTRINAILRTINELDIENSVDKINTDYDYIQALKANIEALKAIIKQLSDLSDKIGVLSNVEFAFLPQIPTIKDTQDIERIINLMNEYIYIGKILANAKELSLPSIPAIKDTQDIERIINLTSYSEKIINVFKGIDLKLPEIPALADTNGIINIGKGLKYAQQILKNFDIPSLPQIPEIINPDVIEKIMDTVKQGQDLKKQLNAVDDDIKIVNADIENLFKTLGVCPLCGQPINNNAIAHLHSQKSGGLYAGKTN